MKSNQPFIHNPNLHYRQVVSQYQTRNSNEQIYKKPSELNDNYRVYPDTFHINQQQQIYEYKPKVIMSGYIIGDPVAFTQTPELPKNYIKFTPQKENLNMPVGVVKEMEKVETSDFLHQASTIKKQENIQNQFSSYDSRYRSPSLNTSEKKTNQITIKPGENFAINPPHIPIGLKRLSQHIGNSRIIQQSKIIQNSEHANCINRQQYEHLMNQNKFLHQKNINLQSENNGLKNEINLLRSKSFRINQLQTEITQLRSQILIKNTQNLVNHSLPIQMASLPSHNSHLSPNKYQQIQKMILSYVENYKQSILEQQKLLIDRFRLECKNQEIDQKKHQLDRSRQKRVNTLYQSNILQHSNSYQQSNGQFKRSSLDKHRPQSSQVHTHGRHPPGRHFHNQ